MRVIQSIGSMWVTFWTQVPVPALFLMPLALVIGTEPFALGRLSLEFQNIFGDPAARHELAMYLESRDSPDMTCRRAVRLYELNLARDSRSAERFLGIAHRALTSGRPQHLLSRRPVEKLAPFAEKLARFGAYEIYDPDLMRLRAYQLTDEQYLSAVGPHVHLEIPALGGNHLMSGAEARAIKAYALLLAASKLDGRPSGSLLSRLARQMNPSHRQLAETYSRKLIDSARFAPRLESLNRTRWSDVWTLIWKTAALVFFSVSCVASIAMQLGSWVVLGARSIRPLLVPAVYLLSPLPFVFGYHLIHGLSFAQPLPLLAPMTGLAMVVYILSVLAMRNWMASRADVCPSEI